MFCDGKYHYTCTFIARHLDPDCPKPQPLYAQVALSSAPKKGMINKNSTPVSKVAIASNSGPAPLAPKSLPTAKRRFDATRSTPTQHHESSLIGATFPDLAPGVLSDANCTRPQAVTATINDKGSVTLLVSDPTTPAGTFAPYFDALTSQLNRSFPGGDSPSLLFGLAPNKVQLAIHSLQLAIHSLPLAFLPADPEELFNRLAVSILNSKDVRIP